MKLNSAGIQLSMLAAISLKDSSVALLSNCVWAKKIAPYAELTIKQCILLVKDSFFQMCDVPLNTDSL